MKAVWVERFGEPEVMRLRDVPAPDPEPGRTIVAITVAGVNYFDVYRRRGDQGGEARYVPGIEGVGVVVGADPSGDGPAEGRRVAWVNQPGGYAEVASVPSHRLVELTDHAPDDQVVAAHLLQGLTAHYLTQDAFEVRAGCVVVVHAAGGGTGRLLTQRATAHGARVVATASGPEKAERARSAGAEVVVPYDQLLDAVREVSGGCGADVVYDGVGGPTFDASLAALRPRGTLVAFGQAGGPVPAVDVQRLNAGGSLFLTRPNLDHYIADRAELTARVTAVLAEMADGVISAHVDQVLPLAQAVTAHHLLEGRRSHGKLLLDVAR